MRVWLTIALLCLCATAQGTTYYAATNGISGNTGLTTASPWPLDWALSHAGDSNTIIVMPGTFTGHFVAGSPGQIIQSQIRWQAKLVNDHASLSTISIFPASASNVTVSGFEVTGAKKASGIFTEANYSTIEWNWVHDNGTNAPTTGFDNGIEAHDLTGTLVQFNLLEHNGNSGTTGHGVYMNGTNCTARGNVARYNNSSGIAFYRDIADNANEGSLNVHIDNNLVYGNSEYQLLLGSQYGREFDLVGNTVLGTNASIGFIYAGQTAPCITVNATNNIFYNIGNTFQLGCGSVVGDYNLMNSAYFTQAHGVITNNPHFQDQANGLYWLTANAPSTGAALGSAHNALNFFGGSQQATPDIGAFQFIAHYTSDVRVLDPSPANGADYWGPIKVGTTSYATTVERVDAGNALSLCVNGDTLSLPVGTADWVSTLIATQSITIEGAGIGQTVILDDIIEVNNDNTTQSVIDLEATNSTFYRITGLTINRGTNRLVAPASAFGTIQVQATKPVRIDHVAFGQPLNRCIYFQGGWGSLVDHCTFIQNDEQGIFVGAKSLFPPADNWGDGSWSTATPFGTTNALVIEDCYFEDVRPAPGIGKNAVDSQYGAVWTFRYNTVVNANTGAHGSESGARVRSAKQYELYHNTFTTDGRESTAFNPRGGTGVIWSNTASGYNNLARINVNRSTDSFSTWGGATGTNPFDSNDPFGVYATGTHTGTNAATQLTKSGAGWTPNQWYAYTVTNAASGLFSIITSNTTDTIYYLGAKANLGIANPLVWNTGDTFYIQRVLVVLDQVGYSTGGRMSNNPPSPLTWIGDTSVPLYSWGNSIGAMDEVVSGYPSCQENRDYFNSTPKPGYVALVYPHPWIGGGGSIPPFIIGPPQNITIRVGGNASFSVTASGDSPLAYQWLLSGSEISGATTTVYTTNNVTFNANGAQYSVVVTNAFGSVTSSPALLTVQNLALMSGNIHLKGNGHSK